MRNADKKCLIETHRTTSDRDKLLRGEFSEGSVHREDWVNLGLINASIEDSLE